MLNHLVGGVLITINHRFLGVFNTESVIFLSGAFQLPNSGSSLFEEIPQIQTNSAIQIPLIKVKSRGFKSPKIGNLICQKIGDIAAIEVKSQSMKLNDEFDSHSFRE